MIEIQINNLKVVYPIYDSDSFNLRKNILSTLKNKDIIEYKAITALNNINLHFKQGDRIGIIGSNGAGKTTLLKTISGILEPSEGNIYVKGALFPLIDINMGLQPDATGYENIFIVSHLFGISKKIIKENINDIIEFSEIGNDIFRAVRTYSSGMILRLASSIIFNFKPDIMLIDEFFGAGDNQFLMKVRKKIEETIESSGIFILSSHNTLLIERYCNKIVKLEKGKLVEFK